MKVTISTIGSYRKTAKFQKAWQPEKATVNKIDIFMGYITQRGTNRYDSGVSTSKDGIIYVSEVFTHGIRKFN